MRLIDADSDKLEELIYDNTYSPEYHRIMRGIQNLPTVDAVPVVRCEDCKHHNVVSGNCDYLAATTLDSWYCWNGELLTNGTRKGGDE